MRLLALSLLLSCVILAQTDPADEQDLALVDAGLTTIYPAEEIWKSAALQDTVDQRADDMLAAAERLVRRQEKRIDDALTQAEQGKLSGAELKAVFAEMRRRTEKQSLVIDHANVLKDIVLAIRAESYRGTGRFGPVIRYDGRGFFTNGHLSIIRTAFTREFGRPLPISAHGSTDLHRRMGFDHTGRVDVAVSPDQREGRWLMRFLETLKVPYYGFRMAIRGSATAPHIHIGPGSTRIRAARITTARPPTIRPGG